MTEVDQTELEQVEGGVDGKDGGCIVINWPWPDTPPRDDLQ